MINKLYKYRMMLMVVGVRDPLSNSRHNEALQSNILSRSATAALYLM